MIERIVARRVARLQESVLAQAAADLPDLAARAVEQGVAIEGAGLGLRRLSDARLRVLGRSSGR